jgi:glutamate decarboxylase
MKNLTSTADYLSHQLQEMGFVIMSDSNGEGLPVVAFRLSPTQNMFFDEWALARKLREKGWIVPAYTMAADCQTMGMMRVVVRTDFSMARCESLVRDVQGALEALARIEIQNIQRYQA